MACEHCAKVRAGGPLLPLFQKEVPHLIKHLKSSKDREHLRLVLLLEDGDVIPDKMWVALYHAVQALRDALIMLPDETLYRKYRNVLGFTTNLEHGRCSEDA